MLLNLTQVENVSENAKSVTAISPDHVLTHRTASAAAHSAGRMAWPCDKCGALRWKLETPGLCCSGGKVKLAMPNVPEELRQLYSGGHEKSSVFLTNIRKYNAALHMTSFGVDERRMPRGCISVVVHGEIHHRIGSLLSEESNRAKFCQVFFCDSELETRLQMVQGLDRQLLELLQTLLHRENSYVRSFKAAIERLAEDPTLQNACLVIRADRKPSGEHVR